MIAANGQYKEGKTDGNDSHIIGSIWHYIRCSSKKEKQWMKKNKWYCCNGYTWNNQNRQSCAGDLAGFFFITGTHFQVIIGSTANAQKQSGSSGNSSNWKGNIGSCISKHSYALTDKNLVYDVVEGVYQHTDNGWYGKSGDQSSYRCRTQRINCMWCIACWFQTEFLFL